jgi:hypothetical protein
MSTIQLKDGVTLAGLRPEMQHVLIVADEIWLEHGKQVTITCHMDGGHSPTSLHYSGYALDIRSRIFGKEEQVVVMDKLRDELGRDYDVVLHSTHFHIEYDPK